MCFSGDAHKEFFATGNKLPWSDLCEHQGMGMSPGEVIACRLYAVYCVEIARFGRAMRGDPHPSDEP